MVSYGSNRSPSLKKMDYNHNGARYGGSGKKFDFGHIVGDPFSLATIAIATVSECLSGWRRHGELTWNRLAGS